jgi:hypothetical protein
MNEGFHAFGIRAEGLAPDDEILLVGNLGWSFSCKTQKAENGREERKNGPSGLLLFSPSPGS